MLLAFEPFARRNPIRVLLHLFCPFQLLSCNLRPRISFLCLSFRPGFGIQFWKSYTQLLRGLRLVGSTPLWAYSYLNLRLLGLRHLSLRLLGLKPTLSYVYFPCFSRRSFPLRRSYPTTASGIRGGKVRWLFDYLRLLEVSRCLVTL